MSQLFSYYLSRYQITLAVIEYIYVVVFSICLLLLNIKKIVRFFKCFNFKLEPFVQIHSFIFFWLQASDGVIDETEAIAMQSERFCAICSQFLL